MCLGDKVDFVISLLKYCLPKPLYIKSEQHNLQAMPNLSPLFSHISDSPNSEYMPAIFEHVKFFTVPSVISLLTTWRPACL